MLETSIFTMARPSKSLRILLMARATFFSRFIGEVERHNLRLCGFSMCIETAACNFATFVQFMEDIPLQNGSNSWELLQMLKLKPIKSIQQCGCKVRNPSFQVLTIGICKIRPLDILLSETSALSAIAHREDNSLSEINVLSEICRL
ncbi:hypothetical protein JHK87_010085 [Glycine soja]|nr:hypothetical protein JHK87_010085 [Glycine soja]